MSLGEGLLFGFDADSLRRKARNAHFEVQEFGARVLLEGAADGSDLTDRGLCEVFDVHGGELLVEHLLRNESCHYLRCFVRIRIRRGTP